MSPRLAANYHFTPQTTGRVAISRSLVLQFQQGGLGRLGDTRGTGCTGLTQALRGNHADDEAGRARLLATLGDLDPAELGLEM